MNIDALKSGELGQYFNLISNPDFIKAIRSAANTGNSTGKYDSLLDNLDKLSELLSQSNNINSSASGQLPAASALVNAQNPENLELGKIVDDLIAKADLMQSLLDLDIIPPDEQLVDFLAKLRQIISNLDKETRKLQADQKEKEPKTEYKLAPSSATKSGFVEGLTLLAK